MQDYRRSSAAGSPPASTERHRQSPARQDDAPSSMASDSLHEAQTLEDYSRIMHRHTQRQIERLSSVVGQDGNDRNRDTSRSPRVSQYNNIGRWNNGVQ
ncbi:hypothetical protein ACJ73_05535 [Blastomyces percursus]|uniref:Uncharacterized protein n=1 Tax=Blastomyces percursus TaxID=1658174 RepID=A0A1J9R532_9EURO|nr:hypothetical protein ACJ73_05535 [Blastomyces percursus]